MALNEPRLLYTASIRRLTYFRQFWRSLLLIFVIGAAWLALREASNRGVVDNPVLIDVGLLAAVVAAALLAVRCGFNLYRWLVRRDESVQVFDRGLVWTRKGETHKYSWGKMDTYRAGGNGLYLRRLPLLQWGTHRIKMEDGAVLAFDGRFGDMRPFAAAVLRPTSKAGGMRIGQKIRNNQSVRLHPRLLVLPTGISSGKHDIHWSDLDVRRHGSNLRIRKRGKKDGFITVANLSMRKVDNAGGFMDLAVETIRNNQPERFNQIRHQVKTA